MTRLPTDTEELESLLNNDTIASRAQHAPDPSPIHAQRGKTLWDFACWMLYNGGPRGWKRASNLLRRLLWVLS